MKTNAFLTIKVLGIIALTMIACTGDETSPNDVGQPHGAPVFNQSFNYIYTPFFTSGSDTLVGHVSWGYEKGKLSITAPEGIVLKNEELCVLSWNHDLPEGIYPITVTAENSKGSVKDNIFLASKFGGNFIGSYSYHLESGEVMVEERPFYFDLNGIFVYDDPWDYENSIEGLWSWTSKNEIQITFKKYGQVGDYLLKVTMVYDKDTGLPFLSGYWTEPQGVGDDKRKGEISFSFDQDSELTAVYNRENHVWDIGSDNQDYPQIVDFWNTEDPDQLGGWFIASCKAGPEQKNYRLYLGKDKKIFRGKNTENESWKWVSNKEIQGTFMEHQEFLGTGEKFISFKGTVSTDWDYIIGIKGKWYHGKNVVEGMEAGEIEMYWERRF